MRGPVAGVASIRYSGRRRDFIERRATRTRRPSPRASNCRPVRPRPSRRAGRPPPACRPARRASPTTTSSSTDRRAAPRRVSQHAWIGASEKAVTESTTSLIFRASVQPERPAARGCLSYSMYSCRNPSHVISANTLTLRSGKRRNASITARSIEEEVGAARRHLLHADDVAA